MSARWEGDTTLKFVQLYRSHECLWNWKSFSYVNRKARDEAYKQIQLAMNIKGFGVSEVKNKIRTLRSTYSQELKKIRLSKKHGCENVYVPNIIWFKEMNEFLQLNKPRKSFLAEMATYDVTNDQWEPKQEPAFQESSDNEFDEEAERGIKDEESDFLLTQSDHEVFLPSIKKPKLEIRDDLEPEQMPAEDENEFDIFGRHVAAQMKQLTVANAVMAQEKIQSLLTSYRLQELNY